MQNLIRFSEHILFLEPSHETDRPLLAAIVGSERTLLIDAGNSLRHANLFLNHLKTFNIQGDWLAITHHDWDHVFGLSEFKIPVIAHYSTRDEIKKLQCLSWADEALEQRVRDKTQTSFSAINIKKELGNERDVVIPLPNITYMVQMSMDLGGVSCLIEHVGGDHAYDSSVVYIPEEKVLFVGDAMYANTKTWSYTTENTLKLIHKLEKYDLEVCFLSHQEKPLTKAEYLHELNVLRDIAVLTEKFKGDRKSISEELANRLARSLSEDEIETIDFFLNGFHGAT
ncbi:MBL fold metallo-hydrolase [Alicyclobacillus fastidiosus]|uniref:MBL fold metallo-hydrolase n=1 Tax=Alicyclobacillus fastidiosus TaxID=392011 RepID=A0ABV5AKD2_9BACL|nr:MBL fold metallo-hydrolase [Alicyclobacillus fastidiosus]WEH08447.1 MBL fold metallo-hydrolase [Alicyclobacillus fastidiosus]